MVVAVTIVVSCPQCHKQSKAPAEVRGKKIRCKACGHIFAARASGQRPAPAKQAQQTQDEDLKQIEVKSAAQQIIEDEFTIDKNPYTVTDTDLRPRCPHCAMALDEGQVICLECGYNTQTRMHGATVRVMGATILERIIWLTPGIACTLAVGGLVTLIFFLWMGLRGMSTKDPESWLWWFTDNFPTQVYGTALSLGLIWLAGKFAFKRLILHPNPPEKIKR